MACNFHRLRSLRFRDIPGSFLIQWPWRSEDKISIAWTTIIRLDSSDWNVPIVSVDCWNLLEMRTSEVYLVANISHRDPPDTLRTDVFQKPQVLTRTDTVRLATCLGKIVRVVGPNYRLHFSQYFTIRFSAVNEEIRTQASQSHISEGTHLGLTKAPYPLFVSFQEDGWWCLQTLHQIS